MTCEVNKFLRWAWREKKLLTRESALHGALDVEIGTYIIATPVSGHEDPYFFEKHVFLLSIVVCT